MYVYRTRDGSRLRTIAHPQPQAGSHFGSSLALDGDLLVVGAPADDVNGVQDAGAAYVFDLRSGALLSTLTKPGPLAGDNFGSSVALSGNTVVVGAPGDDTGASDAGAAFVFAARTGSLIQRLPNPTPTASESFGASLAVEGDTLVVGAPGALVSSVSAGEAYLYDLTSGSRIATIPNPTPVAFADFARSVAVSGQRVLIGAPGQRLPGRQSRSGIRVRQRDRVASQDDPRSRSALRRVRRGASRSEGTPL